MAAKPSTISYPSAAFPGVPKFQFDLPSGWVIDRVPGALGVLRQEEAVDGFWANAIISHSVVPRNTDFKKAARATWARLRRSATDLELQGERSVALANTMGYVRGAEFTNREGKRMGQFHAIWFAPAQEPGNTVDLFQLVLTAPIAQMAAHTSSMASVLKSFRFV